MVNRKRKYECGAAVAFISRGKALKKLQLSLSDFRRLCILKGIYPQEPRHPKRANKGSTTATTFYLLKDMQFLLHEPILNKMRDHKIFVRRLKRAVEKRDIMRSKSLRKNKPCMDLDHIVKERYPSLEDALRDLDDALSLCSLLATMPKNKKVSHHQTMLCSRIVVEFMNYVITTRALRKVFISIKGFYLQVELHGQAITWLVPHNLAYSHPVDVDYRIMATFADFSCILLGFVNFALYHQLELPYPPCVDTEQYEDTDEVCNNKHLVTEILASLTTELKPFDDDLKSDNFEGDERKKEEVASVEKLTCLFKHLKFFVGREVDRQMFSFIIRACGGQVSWHRTVYPLGVLYDVDDQSITHQVVDRSHVPDMQFSRCYIQPQWIVDCVNARQLLAVKDYTTGAVLPPHLSPFVQEQDGDYVPPEKIHLNRLMDSSSKGEEDGNKDDLQEVQKEARQEQHKTAHKKKPLDKSEKVALEGRVQCFESAQKQEEERNEERRLAEMALPKKHKRLYAKITHLNKMKKQEVSALSKKRQTFESKKKMPQK